MKRFLTIVFGCLIVCGAMGQDRAQLPYTMSFENQNYFEELDFWTVQPDEFGLQMGYRDIIYDDSHEGSSSLKVWGAIVPNMQINYNLSNATIKLDLLGSSMPFLKGYWKGVVNKSGHCILQSEYNDLSDVENEGVFISDDDGETYHKVHSFRGYGVWNSFKLNLRRVAEQYGLTLNDQFRVKIQYKCYTGTDQYTGCSISKYLLVDDFSISELPGDTGGGDDGHKVVYIYDQAGNRTERVYEILLKSASSASGEENNPLKNSQGEDEIIIYPNPTRGNLKIEIRGESDDINYSYSLYDIKGDLLFKGDVNSYGTFPLRMEHLRTGVYLLILNGSDGVSKYKIIKE
ncbi:T9SS type A sorting domain-containing protein [Marinilabilia salmonicolor]|uniref:Putative secreted protein (Por secretion system target) n=1 Tax=Marinilabilia salmonicolor TaxID=989 RepID=A0A368VIM7_9BACT|nr:T9SS type A sorting domain-containing protein [Marinilabilia salmonicolor]RCW38861.1 putative secreted protein (Por secretion system target) [Marinilabilia salmonicolor]